MRNTPFKVVAEQLGDSSENVTPILGFQVDSRRIQPGELFFALQGERTDGHCFLGDVQKQGGLGAVVSKSYGGPEFGLELNSVVTILITPQKFAQQVVLRHSHP